MDIHDFAIYEDRFSADEFADDTQAFGEIDDADLDLDRRRPRGVAHFESVEPDAL